MRKIRLKRWQMCSVSIFAATGMLGGKLLVGCRTIVLMLLLLLTTVAADWSPQQTGFIFTPSLNHWKQPMIRATTGSLSDSQQPFDHDYGGMSQEREVQVTSRLRSFVALISESLPAADETPTSPSFVSLVLRGPTKKALNNMGESTTRGCLRMAKGRLISLKGRNNKKGKQKDDLLMQMTFKYHLATDIVKNWPLDQVEQGLGTLLGMVRGDGQTSSLSSLSSSELVSASEWGNVSMAGNNKPGSLLGIQSATFETVDVIYHLDIGINTKKHKLSNKKKPNPGSSNKNNNEPLTLAHDRTKQVPLEPNADFFQALGVTNAQGKPRPGMASKLRQCQKFVEICDHLIEGALATEKNNDTDRTISIVDMGCGRGYLTFALHSFLREKYPTSIVQSRGIDMRPKLVKEVNKIAKTLGTNFDKLYFEQGTIEDFLNEAVSSQDDEANGVERTKSLDVFIALHACDTATDDALWSAISRQANVIVVAPCCHRQLRPQLDKHYSSEHPMADVLRHNIYRERLAETVTDSIRALLLELAGYSVQVFEFIGGEHTSKNVMITAIKKKRPAVNKENLRARIQSLSAFHGIHEQKLALYMSEKTFAREGNDPVMNNKLLSSQFRMPPFQED